MQALITLGYSEEELRQLSGQDFSLPVSFQIGGTHFYIDVMTFVTGLIFEEAYHVAVDEKINQTEPIIIIHRNHLITNKLLTGRTKDKLDVEALLNIQEQKEG